MAGVFHFADGKDDGVPTEGVEVTHFNLVVLLPSIAQACYCIFVVF